MSYASSGFSFYKIIFRFKYVTLVFAKLNLQILHELNDKTQ